VADLSNIGNPRTATQSIDAALFLNEFVAGASTWLHLDIKGWNGIAGGPRPEGGNIVGLRALHSMICARYFG
jgi:leucyl aminopeptidase